MPMREAIQKGYYIESVTDACDVLAIVCHQLCKECGWWDGRDPNDIKEQATLLCLIHSEISEALEGARKDLMDDHLPHRPMLEVELADAVIHIFDMAGGMGMDIGGAIADKLAYNANRADHEPENRAQSGGKKI